MNAEAPLPARPLTHGEAVNAVAAVAAACSGHVGLAARHLGTGDELVWNPDATVQTASTVKVAVYAEVMRQARLGLVDLQAPVLTQASDLTGGSGVLGVLRPGLSCTVADLCTLMIVVSDNTATNMLVDLLGGVDAVNRGVSSLGYPGILLDHKVSIPPTAFVVTGPPPRAAVTAPLATATPADLCALLAGLYEGTVVDEAASKLIITTLRHQQDQSLFPRAYLRIAGPDEPPGAGAPAGTGAGAPAGAPAGASAEARAGASAGALTPALAHKTGCVSGCRADVGVLYLPGDGGAVAYCAVADRLADQTMTALAEGDETLGRLGAIVLARWWPGPGPVPVRPGWLLSGGGRDPRFPGDARQ